MHLWSGGKTSRDFKTHMKTHKAAAISYNCSKCSYICSQGSHLRRHMLTHSGEKPFSCTQCNYKSTLTGNLKTHMLTHSGDKPFSCIHCSYKCTQAPVWRNIYIPTVARNRINAMNRALDALRLIAWRHTSESTVEKNHTNCDKCSFRSAQARSLKKHMHNMHSGEKTNISALNAVTCANKQSTWKTTWPCTVESSPIPVMFASTNVIAQIT